VSCVIDTHRIHHADVEIVPCPAEWCVTDEELAVIALHVDGEVHMANAVPSAPVGANLPGTGGSGLGQIWCGLMALLLGARPRASGSTTTETAHVLAAQCVALRTVEALVILVNRARSTNLSCRDNRRTCCWWRHALSVTVTGVLTPVYRALLMRMQTDSHRPCWTCPECSATHGHRRRDCDR